MKKANANIIFIILSFTLIISSCGHSGNSSTSIQKISTETLLSDEHPVENEERNIATRICYALQSKSKNYRARDLIGTKFLFTGKNIDCQNKSINYQIPTTLQFNENGLLVYLPQPIFDSNLTFNKKVQVDNSGYLSQICSKIITNGTINNTVDQAGVKVQISFFHDGLDGYQLQYFIKKADNVFKIESAEKFKIRTQIDFITGKIIGMDEFYSIQKICSNKDDLNPFSDFEQNFLNP